MAQKFTLKKAERLKSKKLIDLLFSQGKSLFSHPFKVIYRMEGLTPVSDQAVVETLSDNPNGEADSYLKFGVVVPKKKIKSAPHRNLVKRRSREAYRLNKLSLQAKATLTNVKISLMFIYIEQEPKDFAVISKGVNKLLKKLEDELSKII